VASTVIPETLSFRPRAAGAPLRVFYTLEPLAGAIGLIVLMPVIAALAAVIALLSRRSPLVRHTRVGWRGAPLRMLKLRTMWDRNRAPSSIFAIEEVRDYVPELKNAPDPRVTSRFAAWCRRHSLDELPQFYHVLIGEMSIVGPRPITREELDRYYGSSAREVLSHRPGLVGLWQVMGRNHLTYARRRRLDLLLVRRASATLYVRILVRAISKVLGGHGAY
jgi:lipopolysaccharide/colanic/teichoic acid biosynthesis glycosyltransferase